MFKLHQDHRLDTSTIQGDGTTSAARKGGDNLGFSGHRRSRGLQGRCPVRPQLQRDRAVRVDPGQSQCIAAVARSASATHAPRPGRGARSAGKRRESGWRIRLSAQPQSQFQSRHVIPNVNPNSRGRKTPKRGGKRGSIPLFSKSGSGPSSGCSSGKTITTAEADLAIETFVSSSAYRAVIPFVHAMPKPFAQRRTSSHRKLRRSHFFPLPGARPTALRRA